MLNGQKIVVVMPAYNAARTLQRTYDEVMAQQIVDLIIPGYANLNSFLSLLLLTSLLGIAAVGQTLTIIIG